MTFCAWYIALKARMVGYQLNLATNSKIIYESKGSILLICNLWSFDWGTHIFLKSNGHLVHVTFGHLIFVWGPLFFECTVDRLFMFKQRLIGLLILWLGTLASWLRIFYILTGAPCPLMIQKSYLCFIISVWLLMFRLKIQMC